MKYKNKVMNYNSTKSVQGFIRFLIGLISFGVLTLILGGLLGSFSSLLFNDAAVLFIPGLLLNVWFASLISGMIYILPEWERLILLRLGKYVGTKGPGLFIIPPFVYSVASIVDMRIETHQVEATATLTKDNVPTKVTAAIEFKVEDPRKAVVDVLNYRQSVIWLATEALKNTIGSMDLKSLLSDRDEIANSLRLQIDEGASVYGVDVRAVRITDIDTPKTLVEELAVIARARRASEAKKIQAEAEVEVARKVAEASNILASVPSGIRLRELQVLNEMSKEESSMIIVYPYGDRSGAEIAHGATSTLKQRTSTSRLVSQGTPSAPNDLNVPSVL